MRTEALGSAKEAHRRWPEERERGKRCPSQIYESRYFWGRSVNWDALVTLICVLVL
jgi:hypothetical protein